MRSSKYYVLLLFLISLSYSSWTQNKRILRKHYWSYFSSYTQHQLDIIEDFWRESFPKDIYGDITNESTDIYHSVFLDSYGIPYPEERFYMNISEKEFYHRKGFLNKRAKRFDQINNSHYGMFRDRSLSISSSSRYHQLYEEYHNKKRIKFKELNQFNHRFFELSFPKLIEDLRSKLKEKKHLIFFAHGYNVPYSLAVVQADHIIQTITDYGWKREEILFVPVFWPSNDQKKVKLDPAETHFPQDSVFVKHTHRQIQHNSLEIHKANIDNLKRPSNARRFLYYSNQAYFSAITLRKILNALSPDIKQDSIEVSMISHSLGATVLTSSLINTFSKLDKPENAFLSDHIEKELKKEPTPEIPIRIFMSAPAMPGVNTFADIGEKINNKKFYSTVNHNDKSLTKKYIKGLNLSSNLSATTLGCDHYSEAGKVFKLFHDMGYHNSFYFAEVSDQKDHNIFSYFFQPGYQEFFKEFLNSKLEW